MFYKFNFIFIAIFLQYSFAYFPPNPDPISETIEESFVRLIEEDITIEQAANKLTRDKKATLCKRIFESPTYRGIGIHLNKVAFYIYTPIGEEKPLKFRKEELNEKYKERKQEMFPCYGRHDPVATNFLRDTYYEKVYVSSGFEENFVFIYIRETEDDTEWFYVYDHLNIGKLSEIDDLFMEVAEIAAELELSQQILVSSQQQEIEAIYTQEIDYMLWDAVCDLELKKKIALCQIVFERNLYHNFFWIVLNKSAFYFYSPVCNEKNLIIGEKVLSQDMFPCYGQTKAIYEFDNLLLNNYMNTIYLSGGPRKNSVCVYYRKVNENQEESFYMLELFENVNLEDLNPVTIELNQIGAESKTTQSYIQKMEEVKKLEEELERVRILERKIEILTLVNEHKHEQEEEEHWTKSQKTEMNKMYSEVLGKVLEIEEAFEKKRNRMIKKLEGEKPLPDVDEVDEKIKELKETINKIKENVKMQERKISIPEVTKLMKDLDIGKDDSEAGSSAAGTSGTVDKSKDKGKAPMQQQSGKKKKKGKR